MARPEEDLFDNNTRYEDCECDSAYINHDVRIFCKSSDEATSCDAYSVRNKKKLAGKRRAESKQQQIYDNVGLGEG